MLFIRIGMLTKARMMCIIITMSPVSNDKLYLNIGFIEIVVINICVCVCVCVRLGGEGLAGPYRCRCRWKLASTTFPVVQLEVLIIYFRLN